MQSSARTLKRLLWKRGDWRIQHQPSLLWTRDQRVVKLQILMEVEEGSAGQERDHLGADASKQARFSTSQQLGTFRDGFGRGWLYSIASMTSITNHGGYSRRSRSIQGSAVAPLLTNTC